MDLYGTMLRKLRLVSRIRFADTFYAALQLNSNISE